MSTLHVLVGDDHQAVIAAALSSGVPTVLTEAMLRGLIDERGSDEAALAWLVASATAHQVPVGFRVADETVFIAPTGWSSDRLRGWVGVMHEALATEFGPIVSVTHGP